MARDTHPTHLFNGAHGRQLAWRRYAHGLSQAEVAALSGVSRRTLQRIESGAPVSDSSVLAVATTLLLCAALKRLAPLAEALGDAD